MNLSYSKLKDYKSCPRKFYHAHVERIKKIEEAEEAHHSAWGIAMHEALAQYYRGKGTDEARKAFKENYPVHLDEQDKTKTPETGITCFNDYVKFYMEQDKAWEPIDCEVKDEFELNGITWEVHVDMVARSKQGAGLYLWDHKTSAKTPNFTYWLSYEMSDQLTAYTYWAKRKYGECAGFLINNMAVGFRQRAYKGESAGFWSKFERQMFNRNEKQLEAWKKEVGEWWHIVSLAKAQDIWPKNPGSLCPWCSYRELCLSENDEQIKEIMYEGKAEGDR